MKRLGENVEELLFPRRCFICEEVLFPWERDFGLHEKCKAEVFPVVGEVCAHCGAPIKYHREFCRDCSHQKSYFEQGKAVYQYKGKIKKAMYRFKYTNRREYARAFAKRAVEQYGDWIAAKQIDFIVPVPMHRAKVRRRGYNQAIVFAREIAGEYEKVYGKKLFVVTKEANRDKRTVPMKTLSKEERYNNLKNAFQISQSVVKYGKIALVVDDIYTTGATADALAFALQQRKIQKVYFLSVCIGKSV